MQKYAALSSLCLGPCMSLRLLLAGTLLGLLLSLLLSLLLGLGLLLLLSKLSPPLGKCLLDAWVL